MNPERFKETRNRIPLTDEQATDIQEHEQRPQREISLGHGGRIKRLVTPTSYPLRLSSAMGAEWLLVAAGVVVSRTGVTLELAGQGIGVDPACSGIRMLWHALVAVMVLAAIHRVSWGPLRLFSYSCLTCLRFLAESSPHGVAH